MKSRIIFVYGNEPDPITVRKIDALTRAGVGEVHLCYWRRKDSPISYPFSCFLPPAQIHAIELPDPRGNLAWRGYMTYKFYRQLAKLYRNLSPRIVHATNLDMLIAAYLAIGRDDAVRLVYDLEDTNKVMMVPIMRLVQRQIFRRTSLILVTSKRYATHFLTGFGLIGSGQKIMYVPNAPSTTLFPAPKMRSGDSFILGYFGTFRGTNSLRQLIEVVRQLNQQGIPVSIRFAGSGAELAMVKEAARKFEFVSYTGPYEYSTQISALYDGIDAVYAVYDLDYDKKIHLACRMSEAVLCEIPILVSEGTYMAEMVAQIGNGVAVSPGDEAGLKQAIELLFDEKKRGTNRGALGASARSEHVFETYERDFCAEYRKLLSTAPELAAENPISANL